MKRPRRLGGRPAAAARRDGDAQRRQAYPWRAWYGLAAWKRRREQQLALQPLCERCLPLGRAVVATVANHKQPHRGDWDLFIAGALESTCKPCHDSVIQREEKQAARQQLRDGRRGGGVNL